ncbi:MAG: hypothetical protein EZS28_030473, partial [Streblomastix strix]
MKLPMFQKRQDFLNLLEANKVVIVVSEIGSNKAKQLPQYCVEANYHMISTKCVIFGQEVGYIILYERCISERTMIQYMRAGILLRAFLVEPDLTNQLILILASFNAQHNDLEWIIHHNVDGTACVELDTDTASYWIQQGL